MNNWNQAKDEYQRITRQQQLADEQKQWQQKQLTILAQQEKDTQQAQDKLRKEQQRWQLDLETQHQEKFEQAQLDKLLTDKKSLTNQVKQLQQQISSYIRTHKQQLLSIEQQREKYQRANELHQRLTLSLTFIEKQYQDIEQKQQKVPCLSTLVSDVKRATQQAQQLIASTKNIQQQTVQLKSQLSLDNQQRQALAKTIHNSENNITQARIQLEQYKAQKQGVSQQLQDKQHNVVNLIATLKPYASVESWHKQIKNVTKKIARLGAINLTAIDEYQLNISRKNNLEMQYDDLTQAISTLESAIAKIDKESRQKFKSTFEQVDHDLQQLFPKVFGGGKAYLTLTEDDMLTSGVTVMAQPPGKKNSTIHLLSGGEKALTALSLVFAIFRLNPAPFCMLDEVDAPLDDANVSRFCNLVREMSQTVQFIFISHNKIAMEMASYLTGVTMFEPGVSRMVSVDIDEALAMAETS